MAGYLFTIFFKCSECNYRYSDTRYIDFPKELDFENDQEYIVDFFSHYVDTEYGDNECDNCEEVADMWVTGYISSGHTFSVIPLIESEGYYSPITLYETEANYLGTNSINILVAKLSKIDGNGMSYPLEYEAFILLSDNPTSKAILAQPEEPIRINLKDFSYKHSLIKGLDKPEVYYHKDYLNLGM